MIGVWSIVKGAFGLLSGGIFESAGDVAEKILERSIALSEAETEVEKEEIRKEIAQLKAVHDIQKPSSKRLFSPMMLGQYLIVIPFGCWWAAICVVSMVDPAVTADLDIQALPPDIFEMAWWLIPLITGGTILERR